MHRRLTVTVGELQVRRFEMPEWFVSLADSRCGSFISLHSLVWFDALRTTFFFFFLNDTAPPEISPLPHPDPLPIPPRPTPPWSPPPSSASPPSAWSRRPGADRAAPPPPRRGRVGPHPRTPGRDRAAAGADHLGCGA